MIVNLDYLPRAGGVMTGDVVFPTGKSILVGGTGDMNDGVRVAGIAIGSGYYALNIAHAEYDSPVLLRGVGDPEQDTDAVNKGYVYETVPHLGAVRPSILDNGLFCGSGLPVNQRGDTSWTTSGYHIDRWFCEGNVAGLVDDQGFHIASGQTVIQPVDEATRDYLLGKTITVSCLLSDGSFATATDILPDTMTENLGVACHPKLGIEYSLTFFYTAQSCQVGRIANYTEQEVTVVACKTELGSTQTLAYQDEDGAWQLLPQPESDYATQLARCQRYYQIYSTADARPSKAVDCRPVMRTDPAQGTIVVGDTTYYYNMAEL